MVRTYAGNMDNLANVIDKVKFIQGDICDLELVTKIFEENSIDAVVHFAAESHVDNSIKTPFVFTQTNVIGTHTLLEVAKRVWGEGSINKFVHISTDEVYGAYQHNEKLIPHMIKLVMNDEKLPVNGEGLNVRDWLYVEDHCEAIDPTKITNELCWFPKTTFDEGIVKTIDWYLKNPKYLQ